MGCDDYPVPDDYFRTEEDRRERKEHAEYVWDLYKKYMAGGQWLNYRTYKIVCPRCWVAVEAQDQDSHERHHNNLKYELGLGLIG
jgi:hypothetical protein